MNHRDVLRTVIGGPLAAVAVWCGWKAKAAPEPRFTWTAVQSGFDSFSHCEAVLGSRIRGALIQHGANGMSMDEVMSRLSDSLRSESVLSVEITLQCGMTFTNLVLVETVPTPYSFSDWTPPHVDDNRWIVENA